MLSATLQAFARLSVRYIPSADYTPPLILLTGDDPEPAANFAVFLRSGNPRFLAAAADQLHRLADKMQADARGEPQHLTSDLYPITEE